MSHKNLLSIKGVSPINLLQLSLSHDAADKYKCAGAGVCGRVGRARGGRAAEPAQPGLGHAGPRGHAALLQPGPLLRHAGRGRALGHGPRHQLRRHRGRRHPHHPAQLRPCPARQGVRPRVCRRAGGEHQVSPRGWRVFDKINIRAGNDPSVSQSRRRPLPPY